MKDLISNCFLCGEKSLHVAGTEDAQVMQCINCGYTTSTKFRGIKADNEEFQKLGEDMKNWAKEENGYIWIPSIITLPIGMLYPTNEEVVEGVGEAGDEVKLVMKWAFAPMVDIPTDEQKDYPDENGGFYKKRIDMENNKIYDKFVEGMFFVNKKLKEETKIKMPKLKKTNG